ncbi:MAG: Xaa-Pro aminopeptidase [Gammaproteobacteria bacterium]|nr:MAG: Xaa-Pro aminopeptidase [Gammaproteobacteria bacterium]
MTVIAQKEFAARRKRLLKQLAPNSLVIIPSAQELVRSRDTHFPFRQDSDFLYLSGFDEPESLLLLDTSKPAQMTLFCRERDKAMEIWNGPRAGLEGAKRDHGASESFAIQELDKRMPGLLANRERVYLPLGADAAFDARLQSWLERVRSQSRAGVQAPTALEDVRKPLHEMRLFKSAAELKIMREAARISARAHIAAMQASKPGLHEYHLEAALQKVFLEHGSRFPAYGTIVGSGANACILHYINNTAALRDGDLVLIDAGCELQGYASDITRTFPVNGRFSDAQRALYALCLKAQLAAINSIRPGVSWNTPHDVTVKVITEGLVKLGLLKGKPKDLIKNGAYRDFYMHRAGHWLGLDVHDVGDYKVNGKWRPFEPGMVLTVEPGIYVSPTQRAVPKAFKGIGIRIEDDVVVTKTGCDVLTGDVPKTIDAIEGLMAAR